MVLCVRFIRGRIALLCPSLPLLRTVIGGAYSTDLGGGTATNVQLKPIGKLLPSATLGHYDAGQCFVHATFGYRGVILFHWMANIYDRDKHAATTPDSTTLPERLSEDEPASGPSSGGLDSPTESKTTQFKFSDRQRTSHLKAQSHSFYQCLMDVRDLANIRAQTEGVAFLSTPETGRSLYVIAGLDYAAHEDIMPYQPAIDEVCPIHHDLFERFLAYDPMAKRNAVGRTMDHSFSVDGALNSGLYASNFVPREELRAWRDKTRPWLEVSDVHRETTEGIRVTVIPFYMGCRNPENSAGATPGTGATFHWRYCVRVENMTNEPVQLRDRNWRIFSVSGTLETVHGRGVVGQEPVLSKTQPAFQYTSNVSLLAPSGHMWGTFRMERADGSSFECRIPSFSLESCAESSTSSFL